MGLFSWFKKRKSKKQTQEPFHMPPGFNELFEQTFVDGHHLLGKWQGLEASISWEPMETGWQPIFRLACSADLWCRKRNTVTTMLDPELFERYTTGDDRIDEEWIVQSNPPSAFNKDQLEGLNAIFELLQLDGGLHSYRGWLTFSPTLTEPLTPAQAHEWFTRMTDVAHTASRELKPV